ncbi:putative dehydrogenase [Microbacterium sp. SORGH_AS 505]|uniref:Gfo/Idh/MocA family protein n=1 Tax=Microbacterium sp. SORGH_AS_0505 TaxID=3041770 RepID=UPI002783D365|nr:Gfo/Idh/MocA family oxidoreductase [Microbacterium sp. SORGH_AS_0505]MDQ1126431.1 putative dehydrogenase [Microbacterium sp. SORGH_AS_0505]
MNLAVVGAGKIVAEFLPHASGVPGLTVAAIVGRESSRANLDDVASTHGIPLVFTDLDECLADARVDTVWVALPNALHADVARRALLAGKNVICEKPFVLRLEELAELRALAAERDLILVEAISNQYLANVEWMRENLSRLGELRLVQCEYSQYSSRYDAFRTGTIAPAFDPAAGGGALMDLGIYTLHLVVGLLGTPATVAYTPRMERGVDTSGVTVLGYGDLTAVCVAAKDSPGPSRTKIQGTDGTMVFDGPPNEVPAVELQLRDGTHERIALDEDPHRMVAEFRSFVRMIADHDIAERDRRLDHSAAVLDVAVRALDSAGIRLG